MSKRNRHRERNISRQNAAAKAQTAPENVIEVAEAATGAAASASDCTGLIPENPDSAAQAENYNNVYDYIPGVHSMNNNNNK